MRSFAPQGIKSEDRECSMFEISLFYRGNGFPPQSEAFPLSH